MFDKFLYICRNETNKIMSKRTEIDEYKEEFKDYTKKELLKEALTIGLALIKTNPDSWKQELKTNRKYNAIIELTEEKK